MVFQKGGKMAESEYYLLSTTDINMVADLRKYTQDKWKPILMSNCAIVVAGKPSVHVTILLEREK
jgi:hypothetical protein